MENIKYDVNYFIKKFEAIPEEEWCIDKFSNKETYAVKTKKKLLGFIPYTSTEYKTRNTFCAQGHCLIEQNIIDYICSKRKKFSVFEIGNSYPEWLALINLFGTTTVKDDKYLTVAMINNGEDVRYQQPTAKQRILKALYDLKEKEQKAQVVKNPAIKNIVKKEELILN